MQHILLDGNLVNPEIIEKFRNWRKFNGGRSASGNLQFNIYFSTFEFILLTYMIFLRSSRSINVFCKMYCNITTH
jgi:hypothetical protein